MDYATFVNIVGKRKEVKFGRMNDIISQENIEEYFTLFHLWEYFQGNRDHAIILSDESRILMGNDFGQASDLTVSCDFSHCFPLYKFISY